ncbi:MAG TPA: FAD-dependent monooxygenase [Amycolatopsis sp.]|uniref:FAD-dependent oxidoreductase n=1 Tax=Amycolatopsis sp. TaxID=37632 RepID=UPI002B4A259A|nr:FAD-dependent monooxygenase [Amycolatopsis sp.]HKS49468.1 FAD-dependent monooxygenase [Amycolatopsis sp.]
MTTFRVLIIGGGIGGLCLAQGLKKSGISVALFERGNSVAASRQGFGFHVNADGSSALRDCLPENLYALILATSTKPADGMFALLSPQLKTKFSKPLPAASTSFGVNRQTLREILLDGLEDVVRFDADFDRFEQHPDGRIIAHFADRTSAIGDLLVGADGFRSPVRSQLLPDAGFDDLGRAIYGRTPLTRELLDWLPPVMVDGMPRIVSPDGISLGVAAFRKREPFGEATSRLAPGLLLTDTPDYLRWTVSAWEAKLSATGKSFWGADGPELLRAAAEMVQEWHPALRRLIDEADASATLPVGIFCARPVEPWDTPNVTLLGDAIHTMTPGRGEGANTTMRDAALLTRMLTQAVEAGGSLVDAKMRYEAEMLRYGFEAAATSRNPFFAQAVAAARKS